jgi:hypothetical protein
MIVLPVAFMNLKATRSLQNLTIQWATASELNNSHFEIQRKQGDAWITVGTELGNGTSSRVNNYNFTDQNAPFETTYYRIKQIDFDGKSGYSSVVVAHSSSSTELKIWPNPASSLLTINREISENEIRVTDANGKDVFTSMHIQKSTSEFSTLDISALPLGVYILRIRIEAYRFIKT